MRSTRNSPRHAGKTGRNQTMQDVLEKLRIKMYNLESAKKEIRNTTSPLELQRKYLPQTSLHNEEETMFYGS